MPKITLPDGSVRDYDREVTVAEVAADIGPGLAKAALAGRVDGRLVDTGHPIDTDTRLEIVTSRDPDGVEVLRHSTAHLLAHAVKQLFPEAQVTIGPVIDDGFYYDFSYARPFTPEDLERIEARMKELAARDIGVTRTEMPHDEAVELFRGMGEEYKARIIADIPSEEPISLYRQDDFIDLCRGPHVPSTGKLGAFKLTKVAGAYWRGDSRNEMLQRIYGTAWANDKELKAYLQRLEEAEKRDHRKLGRQLDLFHMQPEAPGIVFWHDHGWTLNTIIRGYLRGRLRRAGYQEVNTPQIMDRTLWEKSGHWDKFGEGMFYTESESHDYAVKPMNCPGHVQIYNTRLHSYRDLPLRMAEFGACHRNEPSGALHGLMRVRAFTQDDAHIFCTEDQVEGEAAAFLELFFDVYRDFGFEEVDIKLATRPPQRVGADAVWDKSERMLEKVLKDLDIPYAINPGEGAFYGPKYEFTLKDSIGRLWQLGTFQLDFSMPERLDATYIAEDGSKRVPVMLHRAILGSLERFIGILIEHHAGAFPAWLAPVQAVVLDITDRQADYAKSVAQNLENQGFRVKTDLRNEKIGFKIREHTIQRVPYLLVVGDREMDSGTVAVRTRSGEDLGSLSQQAFSDRLAAEIASRGRHVSGGA